VLNAEPPRNNSNRSPTTAFEPVVGNVTRNVVVALSDAFINLSAKSLLTDSATLGASGLLLSNVYVLEAEGAERLLDPSVALAVIVRSGLSTCPSNGVNVTVETVEPDFRAVKFDVMSVVPENSFASVAPDPIVTTITPVFEFAFTVGTGSTLSAIVDS
jgi:hypothetical protein